MAANESIWSPFPPQPSARSPKLLIYESLFVLNQGIDHVVAIRCGLEKFPFANKESVPSAVVEIGKVRCNMNADFAEQLADGERLDEGCFWKQRRAFGKKWRDPDDVYIDVERREGERKKQGLPQRVSVLPQEEQRREAWQERKKRRARKHRK
jgi:hypothetical protein